MGSGFYMRTVVLVNENKDYELLIDDWEPPIKDVTKLELIKIINKRLSKRWTANEYSNGIEMDIQPEWKKILREDKNHSIDDSVNLGVYKQDLKSTETIKEKIKNISKIIKELKNLKNG